MTAHQLARLLLAGPDDEVFIGATVQPVDAIEQCPGDPTFALDPYIVLLGPADATPTIPMFCYKHRSYYCGCLAAEAS